MVSLLILKQLYNLSDESVVARWVENPYYQLFSGETIFQWKFPVHPTDLVHFRKRIGKKGVEKILQVSIDLHGRKAKEKEVLIDTTVQEKNITFPTDSKLYRKIINHCVEIAGKERISLRQSYKRTVKQLLRDLRFMHHPKNRKKARTAVRKLKTIAGRLIRELVACRSGRSYQILGKLFYIRKIDFSRLCAYDKPWKHCPKFQLTVAM
jgi:transposase, IS5 family